MKEMSAEVLSKDTTISAMILRTFSWRRATWEIESHIANDHDFLTATLGVCMYSSFTLPDLGIRTVYTQVSTFRLSLSFY